ncbi:MAG: hypothetical protein ABDH49_01325 [Candidatus Hydrothermales bacterium]
MNRYIGFEKNFGQVQSFEGTTVYDVLFRAKLEGYGIFITKKGVSYVIYTPSERNTEYARIDIELIGSKLREENISYEEPLPGYSNYYLPSCPGGVLWVMTYRKVRIKDVYPGIDWVWRYDGEKVHHEFEVKKRGDVSRIKMRVTGADVELKDDGKKLTFSTPLGKIEDGELRSFGKSSLREFEVFYKKDRHGIIFH